jgi:hypothetical protein
MTVKKTRKTSTKADRPAPIAQLAEQIECLKLSLGCDLDRIAYEMEDLASHVRDLGCLLKQTNELLSTPNTHPTPDWRPGCPQSP